jgi:Zn-dependent peptidase ImmA (M78 family)
MIFIERVAQRAMPRFNQRVHTERDLLLVCLRLGIKVIEAYTGELGLYIVYRGRPFIIIQPGLRGGLRAWVLAHEIAHFLLHAPSASTFTTSMKRKADFEANIIAALLLIPLRLVRTVLPSEIEERFDYPAELTGIRKVIYESFKR